MSNTVAALLELASIMERDPRMFDWPKRVTLERTVFSLAKSVASEQLGYCLASLADVAIFDFLQSPCAQVPSRSKEFILAVAETRRKLALISSGDPYSSVAPASARPEGRTELIIRLGSDVRRIVSIYNERWSMEQV